MYENNKKKLMLILYGHTNSWTHYLLFFYCLLFLPVVWWINMLIKTAVQRWLIHWPLIGGLLHLIQRGGAWAGWGQGCRGYGDSHGDSRGYGCGMGMGTMMKPHGSVRLNLICTCWIMMSMHHAVQYWVHTMIIHTDGIHHTWQKIKWYMHQTKIHRV